MREGSRKAMYLGVECPLPYLSVLPLFLSSPLVVCYVPRREIFFPRRIFYVPLFSSCEARKCRGVRVVVVGLWKNFFPPQSRGNEVLKKEEKEILSEINHDFCTLPYPLFL